MEDVVFKDGCMYVLTYETRDVLYSVFDSYLKAYEESTGKLLTVDNLDNYYLCRYTLWMNCLLWQRQMW